MTLLHKFQQFFEFVFQFIDNVLDIPVRHRNGHLLRIVILVALASLIVILEVPALLVVSSYHLAGND